jgi:hypothetical protein
MQSAFVFIALVAAASANSILRTASLDSAIIKSERQGGNFAYSVAQGPQTVGVVSSPILSTQPIATTYTVQQPSTVSVVAPQTHQIVSPVVSEVKTTGNVLVQPYGSTYSSSPIVYTSKSNIVGIESEKQINQIHTVQQPSLTYSVPSANNIQFSTGSVVSSSSPIATTYAVQQPSALLTTPQFATTYSVQQPSVVSSSGNKLFTTGTLGSTLVSSPTYASQFGYSVVDPTFGNFGNQVVVQPSWANTVVV